MKQKKTNKSFFIGGTGLGERSKLNKSKVKFLVNGSKNLKTRMLGQALNGNCWLILFDGLR